MKEPANFESTADDLRLLRIEMDTCLVMSATGRIERENDPDRSPGPRVSFAGCSFGNITRIRYDVDNQVALRVLEAAAKEPPWRNFDTTPECVSKIVELLSAEPEAVGPGLSYRLPNDLSHDHQTLIVRGDSEEGRELLARLVDQGMPDYMVTAGFKSIADVWEPWCAALEDEEIASMCFAARIGDKGAEAGVYTFPKYRSRGLAAAVTAAWASMPALRDRALFYSTSKANRSSQQVAARLGLRLIGASVRIG